MSIIEAAEKAVKLAERLGADEAEAYVMNIVDRAVVFHDKIENGRTSQLVGIGVRVVLGKRKALCSSSSIDPEDVESTVKKAIAISKASAPDPNWQSFPRETGKKDVVGVFDKRTAEMEMPDLVEEAIGIIDGVRGRDNRLATTTSALGTTRAETSLANSHGCSGVRESTAASFVVQVKAETAGKKGVSAEGRQARSWKELPIELAFGEAADRAIRMMDARPIPGRRTSVIFSNDLMASILGIMFSRTITAEAVQKGRSPWKGKIGNTVASDNITLIDEGLKEGGLGTRSFDDEGIPQRTTQIIEKGIYQSYLYDSYTASKDRVSSTGNASRAGSGPPGSAGPYTQMPIPVPTNLVLKSGDSSLEELIQETREGLYVVESIGEWLSNPISGLLNVTVTNAFEIRNGVLTEPVKGVVVGGNFFEIIKQSIDLIGNDVENSGSVYAPSVRVSNMTVAGE